MGFFLSLGSKIFCSGFFASWVFDCGQYPRVSPLTCVLTVLKYKTSLLMQTAEGALAPCVVNGSWRPQGFKLSNTENWSMFYWVVDKVKNVRQLSPVLHDWERVFSLLVEGASNVFVIDWQGNLASTNYLPFWHPRHCKSGIHHLVGIIIHYLYIYSIQLEMQCKMYLFWGQPACILLPLALWWAV